LALLPPAGNRTNSRRRAAESNWLNTNDMQPLRAHREDGKNAPCFPERLAPANPLN